MNRSLPPSPTAIACFRWSARQGQNRPLDRCEGGAALAPSGAAPTLDSSRAILETHGEKVSTAGWSPGGQGYPPVPQSSPALAVLTTIDGKAAFQRLSAPPDMVGLFPLFPLRAADPFRSGEDEA